MRAVRADIVAARGSALIAVPPGFADIVRGANSIAGYVATGTEADPAALIVSARRAGLVVGLPHVTSREEPLRFLVDDGTPLIPGPFGLLQPPHDAASLVPDVALVPLLAFDAALQRLGQGAGHYDRALTAFPRTLRIGVAFAGQRVDALPVDEWDQPLDMIVTETGIIRREGETP